MSDQSAALIEIIQKIKIDWNSVKESELEILKIEARDPLVCTKLTADSELIENLGLITFTASEKINWEGLKVLINVATNESNSRVLMAKFLSNLKFSLNNSNNTNTMETEKFLLCRFIFLLTIEKEGTQVLCQNENSPSYESFFEENFKNFPALKNGKEDQSLAGKIIIEILRIRYNQVKNGFFDQQRSVQEASNILLECEFSEKCINIIGSCLNLSLGNGPENIYTHSMDQSRTLNFLDLLIKLYIENKNKDYLGTLFMIVLKKMDETEDTEGHLRKHLRKHFLTFKDNEIEWIPIWKKLLMVSDTSISFLTGEFLLRLCKGNVERFLGHVGFESAAGFLYSKGLLSNENKLKPIEKSEIESSISSDEEYFKSHPDHLKLESKDYTPNVPETVEEIEELEYLMKRISDYNSRN